MNPPCVVLDTNVILSSLLFGKGSMEWLRVAWQSGSVIPLASREVTRELLLAVAYPKFGLGTDEQEDILSEYLPWCQAIDVPAGMAVPNCRDPDNRPFLELAVVASADAVVTGDKDLLALSRSFNIPILNPAAFKKQIVP